MAEVWYAENEIGMKAAVKILSDNLSHNAQMQDRFLNEAKVMVRLDHPNIRKVYGYGTIDARPAIIMEYLDGMDLKTRLKRGQRFTDEELKKWWNQLVDALNYTHSLNIVHRDIKPSNIFINQKGNAKLLDFGIAKVADTTTGTLTGSTLGTRIYMSPEQVKDPKRVGPKSDVYSLAVTFVHLLSGKAPYDSTTSSDYDIQVSIVTKPIDLSPLPAAWCGFISPYLEKDPEKRPELRYFAASMPGIDEDEGTVVDGSTHPLRKGTEGSKTQPPTPPSGPSTPSISSGTGSAPVGSTNYKPKRLALWLALGAVAVATLLFLFLKPKKEPVIADPDTRAYEACQTVDDYRDYLSNYGRNAAHYADAKQKVDEYFADSTAKAQQAATLAQAQQAEANAKAKAEVEKREEAAYKKCTTIAACDSYLKAYPKGKHVDEVKTKKAELEKSLKENLEREKLEDMTFQNCTTVKACDEYLNKYPKGRYVEQVKTKKDVLFKKYQTGELAIPSIENGEESYFIVELMPEFPGGDAELFKFLSKNIKYPQIARESGIQGKVLVGFIVEPDGSISNVKVRKGIGKECDEEAMRVVKSMPKWTPGRQRGKAVRVSYSIPIYFRLQ